MKLLNFLINRKYEIFQGVLIGSCVGFFKFRLIEAVILGISFGVIKALVGLGSIQYLIDLLLRKNKQNTSKNPK